MYRLPKQRREAPDGIGCWNDTPEACALRRSHPRSKKFCYSRSHIIADICRQYPWGEVRHGASIYDVSSGVGDPLAKQFPTLQLVLQDLPNRILQAKDDFWPQNCSETIKENGTVFQPLDFLSEPSTQNCDVYIVRFRDFC
jgi:hypothetical protein